MNYLQRLGAKSLESLLSRENVTKPNAIIISVSHLRCWEIICLMMLAAWSQTPLTRNYNSALSQELLVLIRKLNKASKTYYCHLCCGTGRTRLNASLVSKVKKTKKTKKTNNLPTADHFQLKSYKYTHIYPLTRTSWFTKENQISAQIYSKKIITKLYSFVKECLSVLESTENETKL